MKNVVRFCGSQLCCPEATFEDNGEVLLTDEHESGLNQIKLTREQADELTRALVERGYGSK